MKNLVIRILGTALAVYIAAAVVPGITVTGGPAWEAVLITGAVLAVLNQLIRPLLRTLSGCLMLLTLGLFGFVIDAGLLYLASVIAQNLFGAQFVVAGFTPALIGGLVVSVVSVVLGALTGTEMRRKG